MAWFTKTRLLLTIISMRLLMRIGPRVLSAKPENIKTTVIFVIAKLGLLVSAIKINIAFARENPKKILQKIG